MMHSGPERVDLGVPYTGWPIRTHHDYEFGIDILSPKLRDDVLEWAREFNYEFDEETGWSSEEVRRRHLDTARRLRERVQAELGPRYEVVLDRMGAGEWPP